MDTFTIPDTAGTLIAEFDTERAKHILLNAGMLAAMEILPLKPGVNCITHIASDAIGTSHIAGIRHFGFHNAVDNGYTVFMSLGSAMTSKEFADFIQSGLREASNGVVAIHDCISGTALEGIERRNFARS